jgi:hypothetical protein
VSLLGDIKQMFKNPSVPTDSVILATQEAEIRRAALNTTL